MAKVPLTDLTHFIQQSPLKQIGVSRSIESSHKRFFIKEKSYKMNDPWMLSDKSSLSFGRCYKEENSELPVTCLSVTDSAVSCHCVYLNLWPNLGYPSHGLKRTEDTLLHCSLSYPQCLWSLWHFQLLFPTNHWTPSRLGGHLLVKTYGIRSIMTVILAVFLVMSSPIFYNHHSPQHNGATVSYWREHQGSPLSLAARFKALSVGRFYTTTMLIWSV